MTTQTADRLTALEDQHSGSLMARRPTPPLARGEGAWVWDTEGNRYLDLTAAYGVAPLGHAHPALTRALGEQVERLIACPGMVRSEARALFLEKLHQVLPTHLSRSFLCNSGTEAMEAAMKFAYLATQRKRFVAVKSSFHGRTLGALSLTWSPPAREPYAAILQDVTFVARDDVAALEAAITAETAAFVAEVVQGEGGVYPLAAGFLREAQRLCRERGALLILDEIQTGFGRTGRWFAHLEHGLEPDCITLAKGIGGGVPLGAAAYTEAIAEHLPPNVHNSTFGANPLVSAAGLTTLQEMETRDLPARAARLGERALATLQEGLREVTLVRAVRGRGLMIGVELRKKAGPYLAALLHDHGVFALPAGPNVIRLLPPLVIEEQDLERGVAAIVEVLRATE